MRESDTERKCRRKVGDALHAGREVDDVIAWWTE